MRRRKEGRKSGVCMRRLEFDVGLVNAFVFTHCYWHELILMRVYLLLGREENFLGNNNCKKMQFVSVSQRSSSRWVKAFCVRIKEQIWRLGPTLPLFLLYNNHSQFEPCTCSIITEYLIIQLLPPLPPWWWRVLLNCAFTINSELAGLGNNYVPLYYYYLRIMAPVFVPLFLNVERELNHMKRPR